MLSGNRHASPAAVDTRLSRPWTRLGFALIGFMALCAGAGPANALGTITVITPKNASSGLENFHVTVAEGAGGFIRFEIAMASHGNQPPRAHFRIWDDPVNETHPDPDALEGPKIYASVRDVSTDSRSDEQRSAEAHRSRPRARPPRDGASPSPSPLSVMKSPLPESPFRQSHESCSVQGRIRGTACVYELRVHRDNLPNTTFDITRIASDISADSFIILLNEFARQEQRK